MIFVTVGTHEQQFDRLVKYIDELKKNEIIRDDVIIQTGYSTIKPEYCIWSRFFPYSDMTQYIQKAQIIVTHGGPSSFIPVLQAGKIAVIVPRHKRFKEHVNDHQLDFCRIIAQRQRNLIVIEDIESLKETLSCYKSIIDSMKIQDLNGNIQFNVMFREIVSELFCEKEKIHV